MATGMAGTSLNPSGEDDRLLRVIVDVLGAPEGSGGPYRQAQELLRTWVECYPDDELFIVGPRGYLGPEISVRYLSWPNRNVLQRVIGQWLWTPLQAWLKRDAVLLVSLPVLSPFAPKSRSYCFAHDWRHLINPGEFTFARRVYRIVWRRSASRAAAVFCISAKTLRETQELVPEVRAYLAANGYDHPRRWKNEITDDAPQYGETLLTFGHRNNKRPELAISTLALLNKGLGERRFRLVVLGAEGTYRSELRMLARTLGVEADCEFPGFVSEDELAGYYRRASVVLLMSSDEGYGLPAAEAHYFGTRTVATLDSGLGEVFGGAVELAQPKPDSIAEAVVRAMRRGAADSRDEVWTEWSASVRAVRQRVLADLEAKTS